MAKKKNKRKKRKNEKVRSETKEDKEERQKKVLKNLEIERKKLKQQSIIFTIGLIVFIPLTICSWIFSSDGDLLALILLGAFGTLINLISINICNNDLSKNLDRTEKAKKDVDLYVESVLNDIEVMLREIERTQAKIKAKEQMKHPQCPNCGSNKTERILSLKYSEECVWMGPAIDKNGKKYQCFNCKFKW